MLPIKKLLLCILIGVMFSCEKDPTSAEKVFIEDGDYIIFGHFYGECMGEACVEMFKLSELGLYEDADAKYPSKLLAYDGAFTLDRSDKYDQVKEFPPVPPAMKNAETHVLGCPDCSDGGGLYVEYSINNKVEFWFIDKQRIPVGLEDYVTLIEEKIQLLQ